MSEAARSASRRADPWAPGETGATEVAGTPKGAELTHSNLTSNVEVVVRMLELEPEDTILGALPLLIIGGYNVYPREIEEVLYEHPAVREAAVVAVPHAELSEEVGAAVALKPGAEASAEELREHVKGRLAAYKYPRQVWFEEELPKGPTGKILKREIEVPEALNA